MFFSLLLLLRSGVIAEQIHLQPNNNKKAQQLIPASVLCNKQFPLAGIISSSLRIPNIMRAARIH